MAASVMEIKTTRLKNKLAKKLLQNSPSGTTVQHKILQNVMNLELEIV